MRRLTTALCAAGLVTGLLMAVPVAHADPPSIAIRPDVTTELGLDSFRDIAVGDAGDQVFVSGDDAVVVTDLEGAVLGRVEDQPRASGLALSSDGSTLYVAVTDAISVIDTATRTQTARWATGATTCPTSLALLGSRLWFGYGCVGQDGNLGTVDLDAATPAPVLNKLPAGSFFGAPLLASSAARPGHLIGAQVGTSPGVIVDIDVTGTPAIESTTNPGDNVQDIALTPGGEKVLVATTSTYQARALTLPGLAGDGTGYGITGPYQTGIAASSTGFVVTGSATVGAIDVLGGTQHHYSLGNISSPGHATTIAPRGLALDAAGLRLFAIATDYKGEAATLHVLHGPALSPVVGAMGIYNNARINTPFTVQGGLSTNNQALPHAVSVALKRTNRFGTVDLPPVMTNDSGSFSFTQTLLQRGPTTYTGTFAGDDTLAPATFSFTQNIIGLPTTLAFTNKSGPFPFGTSTLVYVHVKASHGGRVVMYATPNGGQPRTIIKDSALNAHGDVSVRYTPKRNTVITASFAGDDTYEPKAIAFTLQTRARIDTTLSGSYATSGSYRLVRHATNPVYQAIVTPIRPDANGVYVNIEELQHGFWQTIAEVSFTRASPAGRIGVVLTGTHPVGSRLRFQVRYSGGSINLAASSATPFTYVRFT